MRFEGNSEPRLAMLAAVAALAIASPAGATEERDEGESSFALGAPAPMPGGGRQAGDPAMPPGSESPPLVDGPAREPAAPSRWSAAFQSTYVWQWKPSFAARYSGPKSLDTAEESAYTLTGTLFLGARPWPGGELFFDPEFVQGRQFSNVSGLAGLANGEAQKSGSPNGTLYRARAFLRQTVALGGEEVEVDPGPIQLGGRTSKRRLVLTAGNFSVADVFDGNAFAHDPRSQFLNWSLMAYAASDYAADVRGYTWGVSLEAYVDEWVFRAGRFALPKESNGLAIDFDLLAHRGDCVEIEHSHVLLGRPGKVRVAGFRNFARMGAFADALRHAAANGGAPDVANVRRDQAKWVFGAGFEQYLLPDVGAFARYSWNDGRTETYAFTEVERSFTVGLSANGSRWRRSGDTLGVALALNELSRSHRSYVEAGGAGLFIGDGGLRYRPERILEAYYTFDVGRGFWVGLDFQRVDNPAYNADRGPVDFLGLRLHLER